MTTWREISERVGVGVLVLGAIVLALAVAYLVPTQPMLALGLAAVVLVGVAALVQPVTLPLLAMPLIVVVARVGGEGFDLTVSDAMLALAFWPAVLMSPRPFSSDLRRLLWLNALYQATTLFTVLANPFTANTVEWFHAWLLVSGALMVGWAVGAGGHARLGLSLFLAACVALAIPTIVQGVLQVAAGDFRAVYPRWPWQMHKNFIGTLLGFAAVLVYAQPSWLRWSTRNSMFVFWIFAAAIALSQSRQALIALAVAILVVSLRRHSERRTSILVMLSLAPAAFGVLTLVRDQFRSGNEHNSVFQRLEWYRESSQVFLERPLLGWGLRFWRTADAPIKYEPPHVGLEVATTTGVVGLIGFLVMITGILVVLWRLDPAFGTVAFAAVLSRVVQGQFDLFWISVSVSVPFLIAGVCLGAAHVDARASKAATVGPQERRLVGAG
ncbi:MULTISPECIES: O-antigen ligase family protein [unclassified Ornithinimicrobium]|uniref:O-antigen ligase family protein n=1 Tax=unclassified Ornithinimicrobium TaxID=2615080 RepID=UPI00385253A5